MTPDLKLDSGKPYKRELLSRRRLITGGIAAAAGAAGLALGSRFVRGAGLIPPDCGGAFGPGETLTYAAQRLLTPHSLAREFPRSMISAVPCANPVARPSKDFLALEANGFRDWRLTVNGMVKNPLSLSLADLRTLPVRSQITETVCEEGWSYVAEWIGTPLYEVLHRAEPLPQVRYIVYRAFDKSDAWDSIDMADALHPQTLVTMGMNNGDLPVPFGGPLRLKIPRQLGYKSVKYISHIMVTDSLKNFGKGLGSIAPEYGYSWYAGI
jgi:DMSO/TMAO reductase YedYZ molybdopterin-dependent catalytic subunit